MYRVLFLLIAITPPVLVAQSYPGPPSPMILDLPNWSRIGRPIELPAVGRRILRAEPHPDARITIRPQPGERFLPGRYVARVIRPWRVVARDTLTLEFMSGPRRLSRGDTLYALDGRRVWYRGQLDSLREALSYPPDRRLQFICTQRITYWLQFRRQDGQTGWLEYGVSGNNCRPRPDTQGPL